MAAPLKIASWNINSVRFRLASVQRFLAEEQPDILCLQETKVINNDFPEGPFRQLGYNFQKLNGQPMHHGVAIISKMRLSDDNRLDWQANGEARRITISNNGDADQHLEITSYGELALAPEASDQAHPAFSKMFVKTEVGPNGDVIFAERKKRSPGEPDMHIAHLIVDSSNTARRTEVETDRRAFIGRRRNGSRTRRRSGPRKGPAQVRRSRLLGNLDFRGAGADGARSPT